MEFNLEYIVVCNVISEVFNHVPKSKMRRKTTEHPESDYGRRSHNYDF